MSGERPAVSSSRKWWSLGYSGFLGTISAWAFVAAIVAVIDDPDLEINYSPAPWFIVALAMVPAALTALALATRRPRAVRAVALGTVVSLALGYVTVLVARDPITGAAAGLAAGAAVALRPEPEHGWQPRAIAVVATTMYVFVMARTVLVFALAFGPLTAFLAMGFADMFRERQLDRQAERRRQRDR